MENGVTARELPTADITTEHPGVDDPPETATTEHKDVLDPPAAETTEQPGVNEVPAADTTTEHPDIIWLFVHGRP